MLVDRHNGRPLDVEAHVGAYGPGVIAGYDPEFGDPIITYRSGVASEHVESFVAAGGVVRPAASGSGLLWAVLPDGKAVTVVCSEFIEVATEDGPTTGRCGADATVDGACPGHAAEIAEWRAMSEAERSQWEMAL